MFNLIKLFLLMALFHNLGCTSLAPKNARRYLSLAEMEKHQLNGIINEVQICPTHFDQKLKRHTIIGECETVSCEQVDGKIVCFAEK